MTTSTSFVPHPSWFFLQPPSDLHGLGHTARVMAWACVLTRGTKWFEPVLWAAACHDLRRQDDGMDPEHGFRAGTWVRENLSAILQRTPENLEWIASACDWHVCPDQKSRWDHPVLWFLKDADGLDRARLYDLDPSFLRHREARQQVRSAQLLYAETADLDSPPQIWEAALHLGLPVQELISWVSKQMSAIG